MELVGPGSIPDWGGEGQRVQGFCIYSLWSGNLLGTLLSKMTSLDVLFKNHFVAV